MLGTGKSTVVNKIDFDFCLNLEIRVCGGHSQQMSAQVKMSSDWSKFGFWQGFWQSKACDWSVETNPELLFVKMVLKKSSC